MPLPVGRSEFLSLAGVFDEYSKKFKVEIQENNNAMTVICTDQKFKDIKEDLFYALMFVKDFTHLYSKGLCENLSHPSRRTDAIKLFRESFIKMTLTADCSSNSITFCTVEQDLQKGLEFFEKNFGEVSLIADRQQSPLLQNEQGAFFFRDVMERYKVTVNIEELDIIISGLLDSCSRAEEDVTEFLQQNSFHKKILLVSSGKAQAIYEFGRERINNLKKQSRSKTLEIKVDGCGIVVAGLGKDVVTEVFCGLQDVEKDLMHDDVVLERPGVRKLFKEGSIKSSISGIGKDLNVLILDKVDDVPPREPEEEEEVTRTSSLPSNNKSVLLCSFTTDQGHMLSVYQGDITQHNADAIVNPANNDLNLGGGVAGAILSAGGGTIQDECNDYVRKNGTVDDGNAMATGGGRLACQKVIHAVGPRWPEDARFIGQGELKQRRKRATSSLKEAMISVLRVAEKEELRVIAVPAISSGVFNFPKDLCAEILTNATIDESKGKKLRTVREIHFINNDSVTANVFQTFFEKSFGKSKKYVRAVSATLLATSNVKARPKVRPRVLKEPVKSPVKEKMPQVEHRQSSSEMVISKHMSIEIVIGDLAAQTVCS